MVVFLDSVQTLHPEAPIAWMGGYIATCKLNGTVRKVELAIMAAFSTTKNPKRIIKFQLQNQKTGYPISSKA